MNLTLKELNQIYYGLHIAITHQSEHRLLDVNEINQIIDKVRDEIDLVIYEMDNDEDLGPEYDSAGFTEDDRIVNGQYRVVSNEAADKDDWLENRLSEDSFPHYVTNEAADEDYKASLMQDEQRYENQHK